MQNIQMIKKQETSLYVPYRQPNTGILPHVSASWKIYQNYYILLVTI